MDNDTEEKIYKITYDITWDMTVGIKQDKETLNNMREMLLYWMNGQGRIDDAKGDVQTAFLKMLAEHAIIESLEYNTHGVTEELGESEGWCPLDGSHGVRIIRVDSFRFDVSEFSVKEVQQ